MDRYDAIAVRRSCRRFDASPLPEATLARVRASAESASRLVPEVGRLVHLVGGGPMHEVIPGVVGAYGKVRAPHWLLVTGVGEQAQEDAGFSLEQTVLDATGMGLGTCWMGGAARRDAFRPVADYPASHRPVILIAFGRPAAEGGHVREPGTGKRGPLGDLLLAETDDVWTPMVQAARVAPSAGNLQPWRFLPEGRRLHAFSQPVVPLHYRPFAAHLSLMQRLDVGIALAHVKTAAEHLGHGVRFERGGRDREGMRYIATAVLEG